MIEQNLNLRVIFTGSGSISNAQQDFNIYAGSQHNVLFTVAIPKSIILDQITRDDTQIGNLITFQGTGIDETGKSVATRWYSFARDFSFIKDVTISSESFSLFSRNLPVEFT